MSRSFKDTMPEGNNLIICDGFNLSFRWLHSNQKRFAVEYLNTIKSFATSYSATKVIVLNDYKGSKYRKEIFPDYKAARKEKRATQTPEEADSFGEFLTEWNLALELCSSSYDVIQYEGVEADDIAAYISLDEKILNTFDHVWLLSTDRDWNLLITDQVSQFSYRTRKEYTRANWNEHYDYPLEDHLGIKVIQGDKSDSIPGVAGIGAKRAATLIQEYGSVFDLHASLPIEDKRVFMQNLNNFGDQLLLNCELMDLVEYCGEAIGENLPDLNNRIEEIIKI